MQAVEIAENIRHYEQTFDDAILVNLFAGTQGIFWNVYARYQQGLKIEQEEAKALALECLANSVQNFLNREGSAYRIGKSFCSFYQTSLSNAFCNLMRYEHAQKCDFLAIPYEEWMAGKTDGGINRLINRLLQESYYDDLMYEEYLLLRACQSGYSLKEWCQLTQISLYKATRLMENLRIFFHDRQLLPDHYEPKRQRKVTGCTIAEDKQKYCPKSYQQLTPAERAQWFALLKARSDE